MHLHQEPPERGNAYRERFLQKEHPGVHELDTTDDGIEFQCRHLG